MFFLKLNILSRNKTEFLSYNHIDEPVVIISITDIDSQPAQFAENEQIKAVLHLRFDDVDKEDSRAMTTNDADIIVLFCSEWLPQTNLIVHCEAGISRSAGICAAIMKWYKGSDMAIFENKYYRPNIHCYREVLSAFERRNINA